MATLLEQYRRTCEIQEARRLRNEHLNRNAVRLRDIFVPVNTQALETLKSQWLKTLSTSNPQQGNSTRVSFDPVASLPAQIPVVSEWRTTTSVPAPVSSPHSIVPVSKPIVGFVANSALSTRPNVMIHIPLVSSLDASNHCNKTQTVAPVINQDDAHDSESSLSLLLIEDSLSGSSKNVSKPKSDSAMEQHHDGNNEDQLSSSVVAPTALQQHCSPSPSQNILPLVNGDQNSGSNHSTSSFGSAIIPSGHLEGLHNGKVAMTNGGVIRLDISESDSELTEHVVGNLDTISEEDSHNRLQNQNVLNGKNEIDAHCLMNEPDVGKEAQAVEGKRNNESLASDSQKPNHDIDTCVDDNYVKPEGQVTITNKGHKELEKKDVDARVDTESDGFWDEMPEPSQTIDQIKSPQVAIENNEKDNSESSSVSLSSSVHSQQKNYSNILSVLTTTINSNIRKDRELAQQLYTRPSLSDGMKDKIQDSPVLTSLLTKRAEFGKDLSSWDTSALTSVMLKALLDAKTSHGTPSIAHLTSVGSPWHSIWQGLLEHMRLLFQCGRSLEDISTVFSAPLGIERTKLLEVLQHECGVDPSVTQDISVSSLTTSSLITSFDKETQSNMEGGGVNGYKSFAKSLLQSSHNSELAFSSSEDLEIAALQSFKPTTDTTVSAVRIASDELNHEATMPTSDFDNSLSLPLSDDSPKPKSKPLLDEGAIKRRMGFWDDNDDHISAPSSINEDDDDFEFYQ